jgi:pimeloyl-ACP methyl ester carboxylesterase
MIADTPQPAAAHIAEITRRIDIGGRSLAMTCAGRGPVTVILETGLGAESAEWAAVQGEVAAVARVCRYDRANRGDSDPAPKPRTAAAMVDDLDTALAKADLPGPYIAVGHSYGGLLMRVFAERHRREMKGLVLVDSMHADQFDVFAKLFPPPSPDEPAALTGIRAFWTVGWRSPDSTAEGIDMPASLEQDRAVKTLGDLPLRVIHADSYLHNEVAPPALQPRLQAQWNALQQTFLSLSSRASLIHAAGSSHFVQRDDPALVSRVIRDLVAEATR